jgi:hypothetical protein
MRHKTNITPEKVFHQSSTCSIEAYRVFAKSVDRRDVVVRDVRDRNGNKLGTMVEPHDSTEAGVIAAAQRATDRMFAKYPEASNIQSRIGATDATGRPKWSISPNFKHLAEIGTDEASYIWGDVASHVI